MDCHTHGPHPQMATPTDSSQSYECSSEEVLQYPCSICCKDGQTVESSVYCMECEGHLCKVCARWHDKFPASAGHQIVEVSKGSPSVLEQLPNERCQEHHGKVVDSYCVGHMALCCTVCLSEYHSGCSPVQYIPKVSKSLKSSNEMQRINNALGDLFIELEKLKSAKEDQMKESEKDENTDLENLRDFRDTLVGHIESAYETEKEFIKGHFADVKQDLSADIQDIANGLENAKIGLEKLNAFKGIRNEAQLFVLVKKGEDALKAGTKVVQEIGNKSLYKSHRFVCNLDIEDIIKDIPFLSGGKVTATRKDDIVIDTCTSINGWDCALITDLCLMHNGSMVLVENNHYCLKLLNKDFELIHILNIDATPWAVCCTGEWEVAVVVQCLDILQFVSLARSGRVLKKATSFKITGHRVGQDPTGICYISDKFYITFASKEEVGSVISYNRRGQPLHTFCSYQNEKIFSKPICIKVFFNMEGPVLYIVDLVNGVIAMGLNGNVLHSLKDKEMKQPNSLCTIGDGLMLVSCGESNNIVLINRECKKIATVLNKDNNITMPRALCYDPEQSTLFVTMSMSNTIKTFRIEH